MASEKQTQKAGNGATQIQVESLTIINNDITEERVREICNELIPKILQEYTDDATNTARSRIEKFEDELLPRVERVEKMLPAFADPAFQFALKSAQRAAAATERQDDYALLSELLVCHVQKGNNRKNRAGISRAIEIVNEIDNDALCALTITHALNQFIPVSGNCLEGLQNLNDMFGKLMYQSLPTGNEWLDHLDVLGAIRLYSFGNMKKISEYYSSLLNGYVCIGIKKDTDTHNNALSILDSAHIPTDFLAPNECLDNYVRLKIYSNKAIDKLLYINGMETTPLSDDQKSAIKQVWGMYTKDSALQNQVETRFIEIWNSFESLNKLRTWWDSLSQAFSITQIGQVLAQTNAKRCDPNLPDLI